MKVPFILLKDMIFSYTQPIHDNVIDCTSYKLQVIEKKLYCCNTFKKVKRNLYLLNNCMFKINNIIVK